MRSFVYFLEPEGIDLIKIGYSVSPRSRVVSQMQWSPIPVTLLATAPGDAFSEAQLHHRFRADRQHCEWFKVSDELRALVEEAATTGRIQGLLMDPCPRTGSLFSREWRLRAVIKKLGLSPEELAEWCGWKVGSIAQAVLYPRPSIVAALFEYARVHGIPLSPDEFCARPITPEVEAV